MNTAPLTAPAPLPAGAATRLDLALAALTASRQCLRDELLPALDTAPAAAGAAGPGAWQARWRQLRRWVGASGPAGLLLDGVLRWWQHHPWRPAGEAVAGELRSAGLPLIRRHPWAALAAAAAAGALLVAGRARLWPVVAVQVRPLPSRLLRWLLAELGSAPAQAALAGLLVMALRGRADAPAAPSPEAGPADAGPDAGL